ncbi:MAG: enoyl-CoA hydratase/isomerase family protein [Halobacteriales archaeon]|nr:enoyl-CoA hydratase/isomerase family protein [Halobacteriales archaeon]
MSLDERLSNEDFDVSVSDDGAVLRATIDRPDKGNSMNRNVMEGLNGVLDAADEEDEARVVVLRGADGKFCSGGDLSEMSQLIDASAQEYREHMSSISGVMGKMRRTDALVVVAVEGYCLAGGMGIAASADFVVSADDATFGTPEMDSGLFPMQVMAPIMRTVHEKKGLWMLFTGEKIDAEEAERVGLLTQVYDADSFDDELDALVDTLVNSSPTAISMGKEAYYNHLDKNFDDQLAYLKEMFALLTMSDDTREGMEARMMDRDPEWKIR